MYPLCYSGGVVLNVYGNFLNVSLEPTLVIFVGDTGYSSVSI